MADNTFVGGHGIIYRAPVGTTLPTEPGATMGSDWIESGTVSDGGLKITPNPSITKVKNWAGATIRSIVTDYDVEIAWTLDDFMTEEAFIEAFGDSNVSKDSSTSVVTAKLQASVPEKYAWAFCMIDGTKKVLVTVAEGSVDKVDSIEFKKDDVTKLPLTMTALKSETEGVPNVSIHTK